MEKYVRGYEGVYSVDMQGSIFSHRKGKYIKPSTHGRYKQITFSVDGCKQTLYIHRLVYETFVELIPEDKVINHIDGDKFNNNLYNLECVSQADNINHAYEKGLNYKCPEGKDSFNFKGEIEVYKDGEYLMSLFGHKDIKEKGFSSCGVSATLNGLQKTHRNCTFKRKEKENV